MISILAHVNIPHCIVHYECSHLTKACNKALQDDAASKKNIVCGGFCSP